MGFGKLLAVGALAAGAVCLYRHFRKKDKNVVVIHSKDGPTAVYMNDQKNDSSEEVRAEPAKEIILATNNQSKVLEMRRMLEPLGYHVLSLKEKGLDIEVEETGDSFAENALLKARAVYLLTGIPVIADDSGLCVDALGGAPGIYSARYGGEGATDHEKNQKLLKAMEGASDRGARFVCVIAYLDGKGDEHTFTGECWGKIGFEERGSNGFGYDPIFMIGNISIAELSPEEKDLISHRGSAVRKLAAFLSPEEEM